jgi:secondary thiamine-phosphate synthase enzyme
MKTIDLSTSSRSQLVDITDRAQKAVAESGIASGLCVLWVPHTTAGITLNENADPSVARDILMELDRRIPWEDGYQHSEGNSAAHVKSALVGCQKTVIIEDGRLALGTWQGIYFCEFDGPRKRQVWLKIVQC